MTGKRVKLHCANWVSHLQTMLVEGLDKQPLPDIVDSLSSFGFNCVRLTWATYMFTRLDYGNRTVDQSFTSLNLTEARDGIAKNNPSLLNLTVVQAYHKVVEELGAKGIMVVLDNHISRPNWCCSENDGNGFFGDEYFDAEEWLEGLTIVAKRFKHYPQVVAMSMRNELRGPRQSQPEWFRWVRRGGMRIHLLNPKLLVIVSGLSYDTDLSFIPRTLSLNLGNKLVYEGHWYAFSLGRSKDWSNENPDKVCATTMKEFDDKIDFVTTGKNPVPLFVSEFGMDQRGVNEADNRFISCFLAYAAERDLDWALWAFHGSYYLREGQRGMEEVYGVLDKNWDQPRNPKFIKRLRLIQEILQDPTSKLPINHVMYHPLSGNCVLVDDSNSIQLTDCLNRSHWSYGGDETPINLVGTSMCLKAVGDGLPVTVSTDCSSNQSNWRVISSSNLQLSTMDEQGKSLCLENNSSTILTKECLCPTDVEKCQDNPEIQWFKLVPTNMK
ncbi:Glycoside hydrolase [Macleaya cordata]|nr:Glycoside hydrolase [Macleaya cordata]